jgi:translation initiation factor 4A
MLVVMSINQVQRTCQKQYEEFDDIPYFKSESHTAMKLLQGVISYGFERPSQIQGLAINPLTAGLNVIGQAQSGTGKTGSFVIGALSHFDPDNCNVQLIFLAHTHELAQQIQDVVINIGKCLLKGPESVELCVGRLISVEENIANIRRQRCQILVGTPGRICDLVTRSSRKIPLIDPSHVRVLIMDEADRLMSEKFYEDINTIIRYLDDRDYRADFLQIGIFSATLSPPMVDVARNICLPGYAPEDEAWSKHVRAPVEILVPVENLTLDGIEQYFWDLDSSSPSTIFNDKVSFIIAMNSIRVIPQCIIYVNSQETARLLCRALNEKGIDSRYIYGRMTARERKEVIDAFRKSQTRILVSTDLLSRGFDVQQISMVINFDIPCINERDREADEDRMAEYLHRIGRSGRFGRKGLAINLLATAQDRYRLKCIKEYYRTEIRELPDDVGILY